MKIKLALSDDRSRAIWSNAQQAAERVASWPAWKRGARFLVRLTCCGRADGAYGPVTWSEADDFRESYLIDPGLHVRSAIIVDAEGRE